jgi:hypothetical protein
VAFDGGMSYPPGGSVCADRHPAGLDAASVLHSGLGVAAVTARQEG